MIQSSKIVADPKGNDSLYVLQLNDTVSFGAVAVNDLTQVQKTLYDKVIAYVNTPKVSPDQRTALIVYTKQVATQKV